MKDSKQIIKQNLEEINRKYTLEVPSAIDTQVFTDKLINLVFPFRTGRELDTANLSKDLEQIERDLDKLLVPLNKKLERESTEICKSFINELPGIFTLLVADAEAFSQFDPASESTEEIILCYPGFYSIAVYRIAHVLWELKVPVLPRVMSEYAHSRTGVDIHPGAQIGDSFFIDHGTGTVIGETAIIGNNVKIYQGVTLGALFVKKSLAKQKRHPTIEDNVIIYARSTILGGETTIGHDSVIGGNVWLTESVLPFSVVYQKHHVVIRDSKEINDQLNWVI